MSDAEALWGDLAKAVEAGVGALFGHHPERGGQEREQAVFAVLSAAWPHMPTHPSIRRLESVRLVAETPGPGELVGVRIRYFLKHEGLDEIECEHTVVLRLDSEDDLTIHIYRHSL